MAAYEITRSFIDAGTVAGVLTDANKGENWRSDQKLVELAGGVARAESVEARAKVLDELPGYVLQQGYYVPLTRIVQRIYLQSPKLQGVVYNGIAYANYYAASLTS